MLVVEEPLCSILAPEKLGIYVCSLIVVGFVCFVVLLCCILPHQNLGRCFNCFLLDSSTVMLDRCTLSKLLKTLSKLFIGFVCFLAKANTDVLSFWSIFVGWFCRHPLLSMFSNSSSLQTNWPIIVSTAMCSPKHLFLARWKIFAAFQFMLFAPQTCCAVVFCSKDCRRKATQGYHRLDNIARHTLIWIEE